MTDRLSEIMAYKADIVKERKGRIPLAELEALSREARSPAGFVQKLKEKVASGRIGLIAELKKASPSKGMIRPDFNPVLLADAYEKGGATCLSVLTDERYFQGCDAYLRQVAATSSLPVLRKDFMLDPYQVVEARTLGADCVLLIMAALSDAQAAELEAAAVTLGMDVLVEVHDKQELERALTNLHSDLIGINNRNLKTLEVSLETAKDLVCHMPRDKIAVCESGITTHADIAIMQTHGLYCFLVGESLMRQSDVESATRALLRER